MLMKFSFKITVNYIISVFSILAILFTGNILSANESSETKVDKSGDYVIIIHGLTRHKFSMLEYKTKFEKLGYKAHIVDYDGIKYPIGKIYNIVNKQIHNIVKDANKKVHFVGSSLGAILIRMVLEFNPPKNIGRVVQISPPNQGCEFADNIVGSNYADESFGPSIYQLVSGKNGIHNILPPIKDYELGVIAGDKNSGESWIFDIDGDDDGVVSIEKTKVNGMKEHYIIHDTHKKITDNKETIEKTIKFITEGTFYGF